MSSSPARCATDTPDASKNNFLAILLVSASRTNARATTHWTDSWLQTLLRRNPQHFTSKSQTPTRRGMRRGMQQGNTYVEALCIMG